MIWILRTITLGLLEGGEATLRSHTLTMPSWVSAALERSCSETRALAVSAN